MPQVLFVHTSASLGEAHHDSHGSYTRKMCRVLRDLLKGRDVHIVDRDVAARPPCLVDATFIEADSVKEELRTPAQRERLRESDELTAEVLLSDVIVLSCPIYNFGIPSPLSAWIDNIVRPGKTFTRGGTRVPHAVYGLLHNKLVILLVSSGESGYQAGGANSDLNHGEARVRAVFSHLGVRCFEEVVIEGTQENTPQELEIQWAECEVQLKAVAKAIKKRWREQRL